jgi:sodium-dependent dicarboxylate transporter 2/3/5
MGTPIGSGPNAIAIASVWDRHPITFLGWMMFALPLVLAMLTLAYFLLRIRYGVRGAFEHQGFSDAVPSRHARGVVLLLALAAVAWISEPLHGVSAPLIAIMLALVLFGAGFLKPQDLGALDWSTLGLIGGGITLGKLIERTGLFAQIAGFVDWAAMPPLALLSGLALASALLSAVMSNTATAALLIPLGLTLSPSPTTAVIIAIAASFGMPFVISTPPNAMVYGEGGLTPRDILGVGLPIMLVGCALVALTGALALRWLGVAP